MEQSNNLNNLFLDWENGYEYYERELYATDKITGYRYKYDFKYDEYNIKSQLSKCYESFNFSYDEEKIELKTSNEFLCGNLYQNAKEITITFNSKYKIISSNADEKDDNNHTWKINKDNYKDHPIVLVINKKKTVKELKQRKKIIIRLIILLIIFIFLIIIYIKRKKRK